MERVDWDEYVEHVIRAEDEASARAMAAANYQTDADPEGAADLDKRGK
jgi:hypothetical protein